MEDRAGYGLEIHHRQQWYDRAAGTLYETGVSIAREAQKRGFHAAMAAHVTCDTPVLPDGLDFYPLFRVDHWGQKVATEVPGLYGLRGSSRALRETTIEDVLEGRATMEQYLLARFEPLDRIQKGPHSICRRALVKHLAKRILPPILANPLGGLCDAGTLSGDSFAA